MSEWYCIIQITLTDDNFLNPIQALLSFLMPSHDRLRSRIEEVLDLPLIQQEAENGALDMGRLAKFIVGTMGSLCAPCRDGDIRELHEETELVPLLKWVNQRQGSLGYLIILFFPFSSSQKLFS